MYNKIVASRKTKNPADMAELADAHGSGPCEGNFMEVRILLSAPIKTRSKRFEFFLAFWEMWGNWWLEVLRSIGSVPVLNGLQWWNSSFGMLFCRITMKMDFLEVDFRTDHPYIYELICWGWKSSRNSQIFILKCGSKSKMLELKMLGGGCRSVAIFYGKR